jgi:hypothetical protein
MSGSFVEPLLVLLLSGGAPTDVVSVVPPREYFQSRKVEVTLDRMTELASKPPADPRTQVHCLPSASSVRKPRR